jgi:5'(3')-deoxyribonucleotidase
LKVYPWANDLVKFAENMAGPENVSFLTKPVLDPYCAAGKTMWVQKHFPNYSRRLLIGSCKEMCASIDSVLVDDDDKNIEAFEKYGGHGILFPQPWNTAMKFDLNEVYRKLGSARLYIHSMTMLHTAS